jgi:methionyl-tRNA formyltransferase
MTTDKISIYFLGTDEFASTVLRRLLNDERFAVLGVVTPPDRKIGRHQVLTPCTAKEVALEAGLEVFHDHNELIGREMDFLVAVSYGYFLSEEVLSVPRYESLNVHASLLPKYRGASPVHAAILNGEEVTGVSVMRMVKKMDAGAVFAVSEVAMLDSDTTPLLRARLADVGGELLAQVLPGIVSGAAEGQEQNEVEVLYAPIIKREDGEINWKLESAAEIERKLRAYTPWPGIYTTLEGKRLKILRSFVKEGAVSEPGKVRQDGDDVVVETREGLLVLQELQLEGKKALSVDEFIRGQGSFVGVVF